MFKKFVAKLVGFREQMTDFSVRTHQERSAEESRRKALKGSLDAKERHERIMAGWSRKYVLETTIPEGQVARPNDSAIEKGNE